MVSRVIFSVMELLYAAKVIVITLLASTCNVVANIGCDLPTPIETTSLIASTYASPVTIQLTLEQYACLASGMYRDKYRSASLLVRYSCTTRIGCARGSDVEKELLDLQCMDDGSWLVANFTENPEAEFDKTMRTNCSSCISPTELDTSMTSLYDATSHCVGKAFLFVHNGWGY